MTGVSMMTVYALVYAAQLQLLAATGWLTKYRLNDLIVPNVARSPQKSPKSDPNRKRVRRVLSQYLSLRVNPPPGRF